MHSSSTKKNSPPPFTFDELLRRSAFFSESRGLVIRGARIHGVAPLSEIIPMDDIKKGLAPLDPYGRHYEEIIGSRTLFLYDHDGKDLNETRIKLLALGFYPKVLCDTADKELVASLFPYGSMLDGDSIICSRETLILAYSSSLSRLSFAEVCRTFARGSATQENFLKLLKDYSRNIRFPTMDYAANFFFVKRYDPSTKPWSHSFTDSLLYREKWALLTNNERWARCLFGLIFLPLTICILVYRYKAHPKPRFEKPLNLLQWQLAAYRKKKLELALSKLKIEAFKNTAEAVNVLAPVLLKKGYYDSNFLINKEFSQTNFFHNLAFFQRLEEISALAFFVRVLLFILLSVSFLASFLHLTFVALGYVEPLPITSVLAITSMAVVLGIVVLSTAFTEGGRKSKVGTYIVVPISVFLLTLAIPSAFLCLWYHNSPIAIKTGICSAILIILVCAVYYTIVRYSALSISQDEYLLAESLGLGSSAYVELKTHLLDKVFEHFEIPNEASTYLDAHLESLGLDHESLSMYLKNPSIGYYPPTEILEPSPPLPPLRNLEDLEVKLPSAPPISEVGTPYIDIDRGSDRGSYSL